MGGNNNKRINITFMRKLTAD